MCRLYAFKSTEKTKVECTLVHAQNALMTQSKADQSGMSHAHGWGVATYNNHHPHVDRKSWAAYHGEHFERAAAKVYSATVIAHVRRATVGVAALANTHPFSYKEWTFVHNGTVPNFDRLRPRLLNEMTADHCSAIHGDTDSEHLFYYALTLIDQHDQLPLTQIVRRVVASVAQWSADVDPDASTGLNLILTNGKDIAGSRLGRTLFWVQRNGVYDCEICGFPHIHHQPNREHKAVVVASEPITHEDWLEVPERSIWNIAADAQLTIEPLDES